MPDRTDEFSGIPYPMAFGSLWAYWEQSAEVFEFGQFAKHKAIGSTITAHELFEHVYVN